LSSRCLPEWTPRQPMSSAAVVLAAAQRSLRALGVARAGDINHHFISDRYPGLPLTLQRLERQGTIVPVAIGGEGASLPGSWYVHAEDLALLDRIEAGDWQPRTTLLSPFDNLIRDRARTRLLFNFDFSLEIYLPVARRRYGYYVLSVLHGERLIGRIDVAMNRAAQRLELKAVHTETGTEVASAGRDVADAVRSLAEFLGAATVSVPATLPRGWKTPMKAAF
ncbi:MAG: winged helix DNA-binding domain-containing protein, partial [Candidatus Dormibacteraeota bacterium]|nr:winged helix DNA-binding domain-containing protein [Candidatus Dormibacteraeota bacterium]